MAVIEKTTGHYCTECEELCYRNDYGLTCICGHAWELELKYPDELEYPKTWIEVDIEISKQTGNDESD